MTAPGRRRRGLVALCVPLLLTLTACGPAPSPQDAARPTVPPAVERPRRAEPPPVPGSLPSPPGPSARTTTGLPKSPRFPPRAPAPPPTGSPSRPPATPDQEPRTPTTKPTGKAAAGPTGTPRTTPTTTGTTLRIGSWSARVVRGGQAEVDACRDAVQWTGPDLGTENGYAMRTAVVVGHDFCGFGRLATLPIGTEVTVETPRALLRYRVYARHLTPGRGAPAHGLYWGDLTLQSCVGPDTGFTYLMRV